MVGILPPAGLLVKYKWEFACARLRRGLVGPDRYDGARRRVPAVDAFILNVQAMDWSSVGGWESRVRGEGLKREGFPKSHFKASKLAIPPGCPGNPRFPPLVLPDKLMSAQSRKVPRRRARMKPSLLPLEFRLGRASFGVFPVLAPVLASSFIGSQILRIKELISCEYGLRRWPYRALPDACATRCRSLAEPSPQAAASRQ